MIGSTLSHYRITEKLGQGGMGEVYRAEDANLSRQVAIKVLPDEFAHDAERLARFEREAKLLASLNHPNIASIYGLEQADGKPFLVLELVEGQTLAERLHKGPLPVEEALEVCRQIAEGLEAAHEKGIIHRDLKPANVKGDRYPEQCSAWKMPVGGGEESRVLNSVLCDGFWEAREEGIYYFAKREEEGRSEIRLHEFAAGKTRKILMIDLQSFAFASLTASPGGRTILYPHYDEAPTDLMLVENFR